MSKKQLFLYLPIVSFLLPGCNPVDRSSEQPFAPTVRNVGWQVEADSCLLQGEVLSSPNSRLKGCGFLYGNDTLRTETVSDVPTQQFTAFTRRLEPGVYYAVAFAENGVGKSYAADTIFFEITE
jgi:hypothetical protein